MPIGYHRQANWRQEFGATMLPTKERRTEKPLDCVLAPSDYRAGEPRRAAWMAWIAGRNREASEDRDNSCVESPRIVSVRNVATRTGIA